MKTARTARRRPAGRSRARGAFTLLEIIIAMAIMLVICGTIYQFTNTMLRAADISLHEDERAQNYAGLRRLLNSQLSSLAARQSGAFVGMNVTGKGGGRRDALQMVCSAGNAVLTPDARGLYQITLALRESPRGSGRYALGMDRQPWTDDDDDDDDDNPPKGTAKGKDALGDLNKPPSDWVKLMDGVRSLEIAYFDSRLNAWVEKWIDPQNLPSLVRVRLATENGGQPYEIIERVPAGGIVQAPTNIITSVPTVNGANGAPLPVNAPRIPVRR